MCLSIENRGSEFTAKAIKNDELRKYANMLVTDCMNIRKNLLHISAVMASIAEKRDTGILEEFDNSIVVFAEKRLGLKKSQVYNMVAVGATFLDGDGNVLLPQRGGRWNNTQLMALLPMGGKGSKKLGPDKTLEACQKLVEDKLISPDMTVAEIKEVVNVNRPDAKRVEKQKNESDRKKELTGEVIETKADIIEPKNDKKGDKIVEKIEIFSDINRNYYAKFNGEVITFSNNDIYDFTKLLKICTNYSYDSTIVGLNVSSDGMSVNVSD